MPHTQNKNDDSFSISTGKPDEKKEKGGDKADDKVRNHTVQFHSKAATQSN